MCAALAASDACEAAGLQALQGGFEAAPQGLGRHQPGNRPAAHRTHHAPTAPLKTKTRERSARTTRRHKCVDAGPPPLDATASEFACAALDESPFLSRAALLDRKLSKAVPTPVDTPATRFGQASEPLAVQAYRDKTGFEVRATGLYTCDELRYGASPDGVVVDRATGEEGLLEVKCLYRERRRSYVSAAKPPARFLAQVQGRLALSGPRRCDLAMDPGHPAIFRVPRDARHWDRPEAGARRVLEDCGGAQVPLGLRRLPPGLMPARQGRSGADARRHRRDGDGRTGRFASRNSSSASPPRASSASPSSHPDPAGAAGRRRLPK